MSESEKYYKYGKLTLGDKVTIARGIGEVVEISYGNPEMGRGASPYVVLDIGEDKDKIEITFNEILAINGEEI